MWTHDDRAKVLGWRADQNAHHDACGHRMSDWQDDKGVELRVPPFELVERVCPACAVLDEWREEFRARKDARSGVYPSFRRIPED